MNARILLAGILGGVVMFIWTSIAHMFLPLGEAGIHEMPNEAAVVAVMQSNLGDVKGLYIFPGTGLGPDATREQKHDAMKGMGDKIANGPSGLLMYYPRREFNFPKNLIIEFVTEVLEAILVLFLLAQAKIDNSSGRFFFVVVAGILVAIGTNVSYWNWYGFPKRYTAAYMLIEVVGFICVGIVAAMMLKPRAAIENA
jgi:hypothetical protein